jgi:hypothetical protein
MKSGNLNFLGPSGPVTGLLYLNNNNNNNNNTCTDPEGSRRLRLPDFMTIGT